MNAGKVAALVVAFAAPAAMAADIEAGRAKVNEVCGACHGVNGVSVSDVIPNLAAQRSRYIEAQLKALKEGTRKNPTMNPIAAKLTPEDIANVAAYFSSLPGAPAGAKSQPLASMSKTNVVFPEGYESSFTKTHNPRGRPR